MKTVSVALVLALNIGVDPPDVLKPSPCARMECWIDVQQHSAVPAKALEQVGKQLQAQVCATMHIASSMTIMQSNTQSLLCRNNDNDIQLLHRTVPIR
jgi:hypothetical protein